jgi:L-galactose dehydrogenase
MRSVVAQEPLDEEQAVKAVHEAFKLGINFFDTSPYYGLTRSEKVISVCSSALDVSICLSDGSQ